MTARGIATTRGHEKATSARMISSDAVICMIDAS
jgi:hypothetical protein